MSSEMSSKAPRASNGTPGREYKVALCPKRSTGKRNTIIGAVPSLFGITSHVSGTDACAILMSSTSRPLELSMRCTISSCLSSVRYCLLPESSARATLVISSFVGPRPPVTITISFVLSSPSSPFTIVSWSSPMDSMRVTLIPSELSVRDMCEELVSTTCPIRISSPIVQIDADVISRGV